MRGGQDKGVLGGVSCADIAVRRTASLPLADDPRIHLFKMMDCRVKPGNDVVESTEGELSYTTPIACIASATRMKPATLAPST